MTFNSREKREERNQNKKRGVERFMTTMRDVGRKREGIDNK